VRYQPREIGKLAFRVAKGEATMEDMYRLEDNGTSGATCGSCYGMYTANSMSCMTEVIGLGLPGNGTLPAPYSERLRMAKQCGMRIMDLVRDGIRAKAIVTKESLLNGVVMDMMIGCSTNTALHVPAIADAGGYEVTLEDFDRISREVPQIVKLSPASDVLIEDLHWAGGLSAVIRQAIEGGYFDGSARSVTGLTFAEITKDAISYDQEIIRPYDKAFSKEGGLAVLKGNLAEEGSIIKVGGVHNPMMLAHRGPARVFDSEQEGYASLIKREIKDGDIIVIRYEGPKGGPGMQEMLALTIAMINLGLDKTCGLITDGRFSGGSAGPVIGHVSPEAAAGGLIALVEDGDMISYDCAKRTITLEVDEAVIARRKAAWVPPAPKVTAGWLARYAQLVTSVSKGAAVKAACEL
jgi:dihydroxy-acid dehydratase